MVSDCPRWRTFGKKFVDFKKSMQGIRQELEAAAREVTTSVNQTIDKLETVDREEAMAPKFEPPPAPCAADPEGIPPAGPKFEPPATESSPASAGGSPATGRRPCGDNAIADTSLMPEVR